MPVGTDMQCVGNTEMIPEKLMECGVLVNPYDLVDRDDRISVNEGAFVFLMLVISLLIIIPPI